MAAADTPLGALATANGVPAGRSGFRPLLVSAIALHTRLTLVANARVGIDLQTYELGNDATGHEILRAPRTAAARGGRVRLLIDDFHSTGLTDLLLGLAAQPGLDVRLYNPFSAGRDISLLRLGGLLADFSRLNRRMHNKLFLADGRAAVVGGRNLADAYFMRSTEGNFLDFDLLCVGAVATELGASFDAYWNSRFAVPLAALAALDPSADGGLDAAQCLASFDRLSQAAAAPPRPGAPAAAAAAIAALAALPLVVADAQVYFDSPEKTARPPGTAGVGLLLPVGWLVGGAQERLVIVSPYFLPSRLGTQMLADAVARGVSVQVLTNSLVDSDEPLVSLAFGSWRSALLRAGVRLFELSSQRLKREHPLGELLGSSVGRLHAKLGFIDDRLLLVGSMNVDPRSAATNTELALVVDSPELGRLILGQFQPTGAGVSFEVQLAADGESLDWVGGVGLREGGPAGSGRNAERRLHAEPAPPWWQRLQLWLLAWLVPDDLL